MTPIAKKIALETTLPLKRRSFDDAAGVMGSVTEMHCFECTRVLEASKLLIDEFSKSGGVSNDTAFLPAPKTWIEISVFCGDVGIARMGVLLEQVEVDDRPYCAAVSLVLFYTGTGHLAGRTFFRSANVGVLMLSGAGATLRSPINTDGEFSKSIVGADMAIIKQLYAFLALINTPRIVGRTTHMPHAGLQRRIARSRGMVGKFPLKAWTEIKLDITPPPLSPGDVEIRLSGRKALHFCRSHLRIRNGRLERVRAHWRGDPALGMKRTRYAMTNKSHLGGGED